MVNHPNRKKNPNAWLNDHIQTTKIIWSPDDNGYYVEQFALDRETNSCGTRWSRNIEKIKEDLELSLRLGTIKWTPWE